ncbi:MAG: monovalent cation/H+ antiporter subunit A [Rhodobacteraceae bacterium]|nr:monovalent cation/H+ antiporter subunit A [Paracoccaceae bacterium]
MSLALIAALPFLGALLPGLMIRGGRDAAAWVTGAVSALALLLLMTHAPAVFRGEIVQTRIDWLPTLGLNVTFFLDGLGFLFAGLILGIGLLIILYARFYLSKDDPMGQFYAYLLLFQGAMVGIVLSDNVLLLLVFWELTSLSSFLLIGYWKHLPEGRQGARMALAVTGMGGLAMIAGMLILGDIVGSYDLTVILQNRAIIQASPLYLPALLLILLGAFTKSAQFPFHFWLPHAMAAPTPVSAYLHSATMVKAGLFLMARLWPVLSGTPEWFYIVATTGLITMLVGAKIALFKDDLKALLAFSTVSHLGLITFLLGLGTRIGAVAAVFHILNHATFKAALFMTAGIVDHSAHTRDIGRLGGLRSLMPVTFTIALIAALSMAGIPPLNGFLSKEMMLEEAAHTVWAGSAWFLPVLATIGALFSAAYSFRYIAHVFLGPKRTDYPHEPHDPGIGLWVAPAFLTVLVVLIGAFPALIAGPLVAITSGAVTGGALPDYTLKLWHGVTPALFMSLIAVVGGAAILALHRPLARLWNITPRPEAKAIFDALVGGLARAALAFTDRLHNGALSRYLAVMALVTTLAGFAAFFSGTHAPGLRVTLPLSPVPVLGWILLMAASLALVVYYHQRLLALVLVGVVGLIVSIGFVYLSAPDLALTQISVEVVSVLLMLLALNFLPRDTARDSPPLRRLRDLVIAGAAGLGTGSLIYAIMTRDFSTISDFHVANALPGAGGHNIVNVIIVDFRAFDTYGEIIVLGIAALVIYALTEALLGGPAGRRLAEWKRAEAVAGDRHPLLLVVVGRLMLPIVLVVGIDLFLRGHNAPGGGFIAGLVVAIALLLQYMASGFAWAEQRRRYNYHGMIGFGILLATLTGLGSWIAGVPFLTSSFGYFRIPPFEKFELATAMILDLGVFLTVVGAVMLALWSLSRLARRTGETLNTEPMDVRLTKPQPEPEGE